MYCKNSTIKSFTVNATAKQLIEAMLLPTWKHMLIFFWSDQLSTGCPISNRGISKAYWAVPINMGIVVAKAKLVKRSLHLWNQHVKNLGCFCPILIWGISVTYCGQCINSRKKCNAPFNTHFWLNLWYWNQILKILTFSGPYLISVIFKEDYGNCGSKFFFFENLVSLS